MATTTAAASCPTRRAILDLYTSTLRASRSFSSYNFREYFTQRTKDKFRTLQAETSGQRAQMLYDDAVKELAVLRRSAVVNRLYGGWKLSIEVEEKKGEIFKERGDS